MRGKPSKKSVAIGTFGPEDIMWIQWGESRVYLKSTGIGSNSRPIGLKEFIGPFRGREDKKA